MAKFILVYRGPAMPMDQMTEEQGKAMMAAWQGWMDKVGSALVDIGAPMAPGKAVLGDGSTTDAGDLTGYSLIEAESMEQALQLVDGHPILNDPSGSSSVEVFELQPVPM